MKIIKGEIRGKSTEYHAEIKRSYTAPKIVGESGDDYILENGNTQPKSMYDSLWRPKKGKVLPLRGFTKSGLFRLIPLLFLLSCQSLKYNTYVHRSVVICSSPLKLRPVSSAKIKYFAVGDTITLITIK